MFKQNDQFKAEAQKSLDKALELLTASIQSVEKLTHIQLETSRRILEDSAQALKDLSGLTDAKEAFNKVGELAAQTVEKNIASARNAYEVVNEVSAKLNKTVGENISAAQQAALESVEKLAKYNPKGAATATESVKTWIDNTNQALATVGKVAEQVKEFADTNITAATATAVEAVKKATSK